MEDGKKFYSSSIELSVSGGKLLKNNEEVKELESGEQIKGEMAIKSYLKEQVLSFINRYFDNIIVLAGAGASVVVDSNGINIKYGKTMEMIAKDIKEILDKGQGVFSLKELAEMSKYKYPVKLPNESEEKILDEKFNLEDFLSNLITFKNYVGEKEKDKYSTSLEVILKKIIESTNYDFDGNAFKHSAFINVLSKKVKSPSKLTIVTTNYDTVFEDAAETVGYTVIDGFSFSQRPFFDSDMFEWNLAKDIENVKTKELEYKRNIMNLLKIHGSLTWENQGKRIYRKDKNEVGIPIMIFPSSNKYMQSYQEPYFELFAKFQELLKRPNTLLISVGFSFQDNHIFKMVSQAIKHNKGLAVLISDYNIEQNSDNWKQLQELTKQKYQIAFLKATMNDDLVEYLGE